MHTTAGDRGIQKKLSDPLELEWQSVCELAGVGFGIRTQILRKEQPVLLTPESTLQSTDGFFCLTEMICILSLDS